MVKTLVKIIALTTFVVNEKATAGTILNNTDYACYVTGIADINGESLTFEHEIESYGAPVNRLTVFTHDTEGRVIYYIDYVGNDLTLEKVVIGRELGTKTFVYERKNAEDLPYIDGAQKQFDAYLQKLRAIKSKQEQEDQREKRGEGELLLQSPATPPAK